MATAVEPPDVLPSSAFGAEPPDTLPASHFGKSGGEPPDVLPASHFSVGSKPPATRISTATPASSERGGNGYHPDTITIGPDDPRWQGMHQEWLHTSNVSMPAEPAPIDQQKIQTLYQNSLKKMRGDLGREPTDREKAQSLRTIESGVIGNTPTPREYQEQQAQQTVAGKVQPIRAATEAVKQGLAAPIALFDPQAAAEIAHRERVEHPVAPGRINELSGMAGGAAAGAGELATLGPAALPVFTAQGAIQGAGQARMEAQQQREENARPVSGARETAAALGYGAIGAGANLATGKVFEGTQGLTGAGVTGRIAANVGTGMATNTASKLAENVVAGQTVDPSRPLGQGILSAATSGAVGGAVMGAGAELARPGEVPAQREPPQQVQVRRIGGPVAGEQRALPSPRLITPEPVPPAPEPLPNLTGPQAGPSGQPIEAGAPHRAALPAPRPVPLYAEAELRQMNGERLAHTAAQWNVPYDSPSLTIPRILDAQERFRLDQMSDKQLWDATRAAGMRAGTRQQNIESLARGGAEPQPSAAPVQQPSEKAIARKQAQQQRDALADAAATAAKAGRTQAAMDLMQAAHETHQTIEGPQSPADYEGAVSRQAEPPPTEGLRAPPTEPARSSPETTSAGPRATAESGAIERTPDQPSPRIPADRSMPSPESTAPPSEQPREQMGPALPGDRTYRGYRIAVPQKGAYAVSDPTGRQIMTMGSLKAARDFIDNFAEAQKPAAAEPIKAASEQPRNQPPQGPRQQAQGQAQQAGENLPEEPLVAAHEGSVAERERAPQAPAAPTPTLTRATRTDNLIHLSFDGSGPVPTSQELQRQMAAQGFNASVVRLRTDAITGAAGNVNFRVTVSDPQGRYSKQHAESLYRAMFGNDSPINEPSRFEQSAPIEQRMRASIAAGAKHDLGEAVKRQDVETRNAVGTSQAAAAPPTRAAPVEVKPPAAPEAKPEPQPEPAQFAKVNGKRSVARSIAKSDGAKIYGFRQFGKLYWSGDLENMRPTKAEAFADARAQRGGAAQQPQPAAAPPAVEKAAPTGEKAAKPKSPRLTNEDVRRAESAYLSALQQFGENNLATARAEIAMRNARDQYAQQRAGNVRERGMVALPDLEPAAQKIRDNLVNAKDELSSRVIPKLRRFGVLPEAVAVAKYRTRVNPMADDLMARVMPDAYKDTKAVNALGDILNKDQVLDGYAKAVKAGDTEAAQAIAKSHPLAQYRQDVTAAISDPQMGPRLQRWKQIVNPVMDELFRKAKQLDPATPLQGRGLLTGARVNLVDKNHVPAWLNAIKDDRAPVPESNPSSYRRPYVPKDKFDRAANFLGDYETDLNKTLRVMLAHRLANTSRLDLYRGLEAKGARIQEKGLPIPDEIAGRPAAAMDIKIPQTDPKTGRTSVAVKDLILPKELVPELRGVLGTDLPIRSWLFNALAKPLNAIQMAGLVDGIIHTGNLIKVGGPMVGNPSFAEDLARKVPGLGFLGGIKDMAKYGAMMLHDTPEVRALRAKAAEQGVARGYFPAGKLQPMHHIINFVDEAMRLAANDKFDMMVKRYGVTDTPENRYALTEQFGEYSRRLRGPIEQAARDLGLSPFIVAGRTMNAAARRMLFGSPGVKAESWSAATKLRAIGLSTLAGAVMIPAFANLGTTGSPFGRPGTPIGAIDTGKDDENGKPIIWDVLQLAHLRRGARSIALNALVNGAMQGKNAEQILRDMGAEFVQTNLHPFIGPAPSFAVKVATGKQLDIRGRMEAQRIPGGGPRQIAENLRAAMQSQQPLLYHATEPLLRKAGIDRTPPGDSGYFADVLEQGAGRPSLSTVGLTTARPAMDAAQDLASSLARERYGDTGLTADQQQRLADSKPILDAYRKDAIAGKRMLDEAVDTGKLTEREAAMLEKKAGATPLQWNVRQLPADQAVQVWEQATPQEKDSIRQMLSDKIRRSDHTPAEQDRLYAQTGIDRPEDLDVHRELADLHRKEKAAKESGERMDPADAARLRLLNLIDRRKKVMARG